MARTLKLFACAVVILTYSVSAKADIESGQDIHDMCFGAGTFADDLKEVAEGVCWGFITGIGNVMISGHEVAGQNACAEGVGGPGGVSRGDMISTVKDYFAANQDRLGRPAFVLVAEALGEAFPCE
ncbi:MAG: Rap1a/Tai family immunity protein [Pseudomonadota bacterium]